MIVLRGRAGVESLEIGVGGSWLGPRVSEEEDPGSSLATGSREQWDAGPGSTKCVVVCPKWYWVGVCLSACLSSWSEILLDGSSVFSEFAFGGFGS